MDPALIVAFAAFEGLQAAAIGVLLYRSITKHVLDPLGLEVRIAKVEQDILSVQRQNAEHLRHAAEIEQRIFERLNEVADTHIKMLGHINTVERIVDSEVRERREITSRLDQFSAAMAQLAARFGGVEAGLARLTSGTPMTFGRGEHEA